MSVIFFQRLMTFRVCQFGWPKYQSLNLEILHAIKFCNLLDVVRQSSGTKLRVEKRESDIRKEFINI